MKPFKQIKIYTCNAEQSVVIEPNDDRSGIVLHSIEESDSNKSFMLYMTKDEAIFIGEELVKYAISDDFKQIK